MIFLQITRLIFYIYSHTHCGTSPLHFPLSSQVDKESPTTLYPLSHLYLANAPILYDVAPVFEFSAVPVLINVRPYMRSLPVNDNIPCFANVGSEHLISKKKKIIYIIIQKNEISMYIFFNLNIHYLRILESRRSKLHCLNNNVWTCRRVCNF